MKIVFLGTPQIAVPTMEKLLSHGHELLLAVSQPDRPSGRGRKLLPTPVKKRALELGIPAYQPPNVNSGESVEKLRALAPDAIVVVAFGQILKESLLELPPYGCINLHASLLPLLRGAAPINRAIMDGHAITGITTMKMNRRMDAGEIYLRAEIPIGPTTTAGDLHDAVMVQGAELTAETLRRISAGDVTPVPQDDAKATFAPKINPAERELDWTGDADTLDRKIRGLSPSPGAYTFFRGKRLLILRSTVEPGGMNVAPGSVRVCGPERLEVGAGNGRLVLFEVCPEGKKPMPAAVWVRGARIGDNDRFENL